MTLTGAQLARIHKAILDAYAYDDLRRVVMSAMNMDIEHHISSKKGYSAQVFEFVTWIDQQGRALELLRCAAESNERNAGLQALWAEAQTWSALLQPPLTPEASVSSVTSYHVFLAYSRKDNAIMRRLRSDLLTAGIVAWIDQEDLEPGTSVWQRAIETAIRAAKCVVVILTPDAKESDWVNTEITFASRIQRRIFPVLARGDEDSAVPFMLEATHRIDIRTGYAGGVQSRLIPALRKYLGMMDVTESMQHDVAPRLEPVERNVTRTAESSQQVSSEQSAPHTTINRPSKPTKRKSAKQTQASVGLSLSSATIDALTAANEEAAQVLSTVASHISAPEYSPPEFVMPSIAEKSPDKLPTVDAPAISPSVDASISTVADQVTKAPMGIEQIPGRSTLSTTIDIDWVTIPAGEFLIGSDKAKDKQAYDDETPQHRLYLPEYQIAKYPITNAQYQVFVKAMGRQAPSHWENGVIPKGKENHPVVNVSWYDAQEFCKWANVRLPSEAEWEKAARGADGRIWPWGNEPPTKELCNYGMNVGDTTPVGKYPKGASPYGVMDMAGNVWKWTGSLFKPYPYLVDDGREDQTVDGVRTLRGGSWGDYDGGVRCAARDGSNPWDWSYGVGFRVVSPGS